jgi:hypothetical protein
MELGDDGGVFLRSTALVTQFCETASQPKQTTTDRKRSDRERRDRERVKSDVNEGQATGP